eukprot:XP_001694484.1 predicted protein [Chlamydomonas reinhardtii]
MSQNPFSRLSPELIQNIASFMHPSYVALGYKLSCKEVAEALQEQYHTIKLRGEPRSLEPYSAYDDPIVVVVAEQPWPGAAFVAHWGRPEPWRALSRWQRHRLLCLAASSHHPPSLDAALAHCGAAIMVDALVSAAAAGDLEACRRLHERDGCHFDTQEVVVAGLTGHLAVCEWLAGKCRPWQLSNLLLAAIYSGHKEVAELATHRYEPAYGDESYQLGAAAKGGRLELVQELGPDYNFHQPRMVMYCGVWRDALFGCPLEVLQQHHEQWAYRYNYEQQLLWAAASPTPDWSAKCEWLLATWGGLPADSSNDVRFEEEAFAALLQRPDVPLRLQLLATHGVEPASLLQAASEAAGAIGSTTMAEFCLDELPALLLQWRAAPAPGREAQRWQEQQAQPQQLPAQEDIMEFMAEAAAENQQVSVLRLLRQRGFDGFGLTHLLAAINTLHFLLLEEPEALLGPGEELPLSSTYVFRAAAHLGADLALLRLLHEEHGARIDLAAVAAEGSEEAVAWAVDALVAAGLAPQPLSCTKHGQVVTSGNLAVANFLSQRGLIGAHGQGSEDEGSEDESSGSEDEGSEGEGSEDESLGSEDEGSEGEGSGHEDSNDDSSEYEGHEDEGSEDMDWGA